MQVTPGFWRRYSRILNPTAGAPFWEKSFQNFAAATPAGEISVRSMLHEFEAAMLYGLARDHWTGAGSILDLGPLNGMSTHALASGVRENTSVSEEKKLSSIYSYDLWLYQGYEFFADSVMSRTTGSLFPEWLVLNRGNLDLVTPCPGDLMAMNWDRGPVEIAFIDLAKNWALNRWVVSRVFPRLIPGQSIVVQQDWVHHMEYWIHIAMGFFADRFEAIETVYGSSAVFLCTRPITEAEAAFDLESLPFEEKLRLFDLSLAQSAPTARETLMTARAQLLFDNGRVAEARKMLDAVDTRQMSGDPVTNFSGLAATNKLLVTRQIEQHETVR